MEVIEAREGATLAVGWVDVGRARGGQVGTAVWVAEPGPFAVEGTFPVLLLIELALMSHGDSVRKGLWKRVRKMDFGGTLVCSPARSG